MAYHCNGALEIISFGCIAVVLTMLEVNVPPIDMCQWLNQFLVINICIARGCSDMCTPGAQEIVNLCSKVNFFRDFYHD